MEVSGEKIGVHIVVLSNKVIPDSDLMEND